MHLLMNSLHLHLQKLVEHAENKRARVRTRERERFCPKTAVGRMRNLLDVHVEGPSALAGWTDGRFDLRVVVLQVGAEKVSTRYTVEFHYPQLRQNSCHQPIL